MEWMRGLRDKRGKQRIEARLNRLLDGNFSDWRAVGNGVNELRIHFGAGYRVYFGRDGSELVILLCGGDKGSQERDIVRAKKLWLEYKQDREN